MATEYLRNKIDQLEALLQQESLTKFQHELIVEDAKESTGDKEVDDGLRAQAAVSRRNLIAAERRLVVRKRVRDELRAEEEQVKAAQKDAEPSA